MAGLDQALELALRVDEAIRRAVTPEVLTVPAVRIGPLTLCAPGRGRLVEDLWLARRTYSAVEFLMLSTSRSSTPAGDFTESASILSRRLLELLGQVSWLTDHVPPEGLALPAPHGDPSSFPPDGGAEAPWSEGNRFAFCAYVASATDWIDIQALRAYLTDLDQRRKLAEAAREAVRSDERERRPDQGLALIAAQDALVRRRLTDVGASVCGRWDMVSLLGRIDPSWELAYRYESDVLHGGTMGRLHQRGRPGEPMLGAASPPQRRLMVIHMATASLIELAGRALRLLGGDTGELDALGVEHSTAFASESE